MRFGCRPDRGSMSETPAGQTGFRGVPALLGLPQEHFGYCSRWAMFRPYRASRPLRIVPEKSIGGVFRLSRPARM